MLCFKISVATNIEGMKISGDKKHELKNLTCMSLVRVKNFDWCELWKIADPEGRAETSMFVRLKFKVSKIKNCCG